MALALGGTKGYTPAEGFCVLLGVPGLDFCASVYFGAASNWEV